MYGYISMLFHIFITILYKGSVFRVFLFGRKTIQWGSTVSKEINCSFSCFPFQSLNFGSIANNTHAESYILCMLLIVADLNKIIALDCIWNNTSSRMKYNQLSISQSRSSPQTLIYILGQENLLWGISGLRYAEKNRKVSALYSLI